MSAPRGSRPPGPSPDDGTAGFTLLDALVALAILALVMAAVPRGLAGARQLTDRSNEWLEARLAAQTVLERELAGRPLRPGVYRGAIAKRAWRAVLVPDPAFETARRDADGRARVPLDAHLTVAMAGRPLELDTLVVGELP